MLRLLDMRIQRLEPPVLDGFQQFVEQHQQLTLKLFSATAERKNPLDLMPHFNQHFLGVADNQATQCCAQHNQQFGGLPQHLQ